VGSRFCFLLPEHPPVLERDRDLEDTEPAQKAA